MGGAWMGAGGVWPARPPVQHMRTASAEVRASLMLYLCMVGCAQHHCAPITASALWAWLRDGVFATGPKYCNVCGAHYKTPYGVIARDEVDHVKPPFPAPHVVDLKAMAVEHTHPGVRDPTSLLGAIPDTCPAGADWIFMTMMPGTCRLNVDAVRRLPWLEWSTCLRAGEVLGAAAARRAHALALDLLDLAATRCPRFVQLRRRCGT